MTAAIVCLSNAGSTRRAARARVLHARLPAAAQRLATVSAEHASAAVESRDWRPDDLLIVDGGDGTLAHVLTVLARQQTRPRIAALPGGSTNMSAIDINRHRSYRQCTEQLVRGLRGQSVLTTSHRRVLQISDGDTTRAGFFLGAGAVVTGIEYYHETLRQPRSMRRETTAGLAMARVIWGLLRREPPFDAGAPIRVDAPEQQLAPTAGALLFAASTLERLLLGVRPHWGSEAGALRFTLVDRDVSGIARKLPGLLGVPGFARPLASAGFHSHNCESLALTPGGSYTIDGELYSPTQAAVQLSTTAFEFTAL